jgi:hypothetical protein
VIGRNYGGRVDLVIAQILTSIGIPAVAREGQTWEDLGDDEILLTGELLFGNVAAFDVGRMLLMFLLLGNILPSPIPFHVGAHVCTAPGTTTAQSASWGR